MTSTPAVTLTDIHYVLCSENFDDIVLVNPVDIDCCSLDKGYKVPTRMEIRNAYFKKSNKLVKPSHVND